MALAPQQLIILPAQKQVSVNRGGWKLGSTERCCHAGPLHPPAGTLRLSKAWHGTVATTSHARMQRDTRALRSIPHGRGEGLDAASGFWGAGWVHACMSRPPKGTRLSDTDPPSPCAQTSSTIENQWATVREAAQSMLHENSLEEQRKKY